MEWKRNPGNFYEKAGRQLECRWQDAKVGTPGFPNGLIGLRVNQLAFDCRG
jgi:hypothetical protein